MQRHFDVVVCRKKRHALVSLARARHNASFFRLTHFHLSFDPILRQFFEKHSDFLSSLSLCIYLYVNPREADARIEN